MQTFQGHAQIVDRSDFTNLAILMSTIEKMLGGLVNPNQVYIKDIDGEELGEVELEQETLSDGSVTYNIILSPYRDPNS